jgi:hypothetical protein
MLNCADFNDVYASKPDNVSQEPQSNYFIGSYAPVTPAGEMGPFFVNTYLLQPTRKMEVVGTVTVRSKDLECRK